MHNKKIYNHPYIVNYHILANNRIKRNWFFILASEEESNTLLDAMSSEEKELFSDNIELEEKIYENIAELEDINRVYVEQNLINLEIGEPDEDLDFIEAAQEYTDDLNCIASW